MNVPKKSKQVIIWKGRCSTHITIFQSAINVDELRRPCFGHWEWPSMMMWLLFHIHQPVLKFMSMFHWRMDLCHAPTVLATPFVCPLPDPACMRGSEPPCTMTRSTLAGVERVTRTGPGARTPETTTILKLLTFVVDTTLTDVECNTLEIIRCIN
jgi:hypothetical protein